MFPTKADPDGADTLGDPARARQGLLPLNVIHPRADQPRSRYDLDSLEELKDSIRSHGILEPLVVRPKGEGFEIVCGERRYRAALDLGLPFVPVRSIEVDDDRAYLVAIHENVHRDSLTPIDEARAYQRVMQNGIAKTQHDVARLVSVSQARVSQRLALLRMPQEIILALSVPGGELTERHARVLRQLPCPDDQCALVRRIIAEKLTVDVTAAIVASANSSRPRRGLAHQGWVMAKGARYRASERGLEVYCEARNTADQVRALRALAKWLAASVPAPCTPSTDNP